jgi:hypothetical protein
MNIKVVRDLVCVQCSCIYIRLTLCTSVWHNTIYLPWTLLRILNETWPLCVFPDDGYVYQPKHVQQLYVKHISAIVGINSCLYIASCMESVILRIMLSFIYLFQSKNWKFWMCSFLQIWHFAAMLLLFAEWNLVLLLYSGPSLGRTSQRKWGTCFSSQDLSFWNRHHFIPCCFIIACRFMSLMSPTWHFPPLWERVNGCLRMVFVVYFNVLQLPPPTTPSLSSPTLCCIFTSGLSCEFWL